MDYKIRRFRNHLFIHLAEGEFLIDTGAAKSFSNAGSISLSPEHQYSVLQNFLGITADKVNLYLGSNCVGLIGADILSKFCVGIDLQEEVLSLEDEMPALPASCLHSFRSVDELVLINLRLEDQWYRLFVDTGAPFNYLSRDFIEGKAVQEIDDFHPLIGWFKTYTYYYNTYINSDLYLWEFARMPEFLHRAVTEAGGDGILGIQLFLHHRIWLDYKAGRIAIIKFS